MPIEEEIVIKGKKDTLKDISAAYNGMYKTKDPVYNEIMEMIKNPDDAYDKRAHLEMLCYNYLYDHKDDVFLHDSAERLNAVTLVLGVFNKDLAEVYVNYMNTNPQITGCFEFWKTNNVHNWGRKKPMETLEIREKSGIKWFAKEPSAAKVAPKDDVRMQNLNKLYKHLTSSKLDPFYYVNSDEYKQLLRSVKHAIKYAQTNDKYRDDKVMEELYKDVSKAAVNYIGKKSAEPSTDRGEARLEAAFGVLYSVDPKKAEELLKDNTEKRVQHAQNFDRMMGSAFAGRVKSAADLKNVLSIEKIINNTNIKENQTVSREEKLANIKKEMDDIASKLNEMSHADNTDAGVSAENFTYRYNNIPRYVALRSIYDQAMKVSDEDFKHLAISNKQIEDAAKTLQRSNTMTGTIMHMITPLASSGNLQETNLDADGIYQQFTTGNKVILKELEQSRLAAKQEEPAKEENKKEIDQPVKENPERSAIQPGGLGMN